MWTVNRPREGRIPNAQNESKNRLAQTTRLQNESLRYGRLIGVHSIITNIVTCMGISNWKRQFWKRRTWWCHFAQKLGTGWQTHASSARNGWKTWAHQFIFENQMNICQHTINSCVIIPNIKLVKSSDMTYIQTNLTKIATVSSRDIKHYN